MDTQKIELISLILELCLLAVVLSFVGFAVRKLINAVADSRQQARMREQAVAAAAVRARAKARGQVAH